MILRVYKMELREGSLIKINIFRLESDINISSSWEPLGTLKERADKPGNGTNILPFSGNIDGNGHTLDFCKGK